MFQESLTFGDLSIQCKVKFRNKIKPALVPKYTLLLHYKLYKSMHSLFPIDIDLILVYIFRYCGEYLAESL